MMKLRVAMGLSALASMCAAGCAQVIDSAPSIESQTANSFFWSLSRLDSGFHYSTSDGQNVVLSSADGNNILENGHMMMRVHIRPASVVCDSFGSSVIFPFPAGYHFGGQDSLLTSPMGVRELLRTRTGVYLAATRSGGLYSSADLNTWIPITRFIPVDAHLAQDSTGTIYATSQDSLFESSNSLDTWTYDGTPLPGSPISAIAAYPSHKIVCAFSNPGRVSVGDPRLLQQSSVKFSGIPSYLSTDVVALATMEGTDTTQHLWVASGQSVTHYVNMAFVDAKALPTPTAMVRQDSTIYVGCANGEIDLSVGSSFKWSNVPKYSASAVLCLAAAGDSTIISGAADKTISKLLGKEVSESVLAPMPPLAIVVDPDRSVEVGDSLGTVTLSPQGGLRRNSGPATVTSRIHRAGGPTFLVQSAFRRGDSWSAGGITGPLLSQPIPITARVVDHVDSLIETDAKAGLSTKHGESIIVRYAYESKVDYVDATLPFSWLVYYTKGVGPIRIEQYNDSSGVPAHVATLVP